MRLFMFGIRTYLNARLARGLGKLVGGPCEELLFQGWHGVRVILAWQ